MAVERRDPVPPGRYSLFVSVAEGQDFGDWVREHGVHVLASIPKKALASNTPVFATTWDGDIIENLVGSAVLFDLTAATPWVGLGLPTIETGLSVEAFRARETENPEFIPGPEPMDELKGIVMLGVAAYLGGILLQRAMR
ncbi:MAG TPA: hypothetical protein VGK73_04105 [Polyangiaceae bacterium]